MKKLMAANWKMYKTAEEGFELVQGILAALKDKLPVDREVLICPPFTALNAARKALGASSGAFFLGGQNFYPAKEGAFTGEIAPSMLLEHGCTFALVGHSERRHVLGEKDDFLAEKVKFGLKSGLKIILCVGEKKEQRLAGEVEAVLDQQLRAGLVFNDYNDSDCLAIAYEPVWAIGTGLVAEAKDILEAHAHIRKRLKEILGDAKGSETRILYGGSVKPENTKGIIELDNVDGVLVGGASLQVESFVKIVTA